MRVNLTKVQEIKNSLHTNLAQMGTFPQCVLLDYPSHGNIGDHLIGLGEIFYFNNVLKTRITYITDWQNFSPEVMQYMLEDYPIVLHGGGNLGDLWYRHQQFRESIIEKYTDRPIIILPQTINFQNKKKLERARKIFNSHSNLTIFVRDNYSYDLGIKYFDNCKIVLSPDMAFQLVDSPEFVFEVKNNNSILYLDRTDLELNKSLGFRLPIDSNLVSEDWVSYQKKWNFNHSKNSIKMQIIRLYREIIQRGLLTPQEFFLRQQWMEKQIEINNLNHLSRSCLEMIRLSLGLTYSGIRQLKSHRLVITNRLHGHILCSILSMPHIFLPNAYYKNQSFYQTWTSTLPFCRFIEDPAQIQGAVQELLEW